MLRNFLSKIFCLYMFAGLLLIYCAMCEHAFTEKIVDTSLNTIVLFNSEIQFKKSGGAAVSASGKHFNSFAFPSLNYVNDVLVVFAQAEKEDEEDDDNITCDIVEGHIEFKNVIDGTLSNTVAEKWKTHFITENVDNGCAGSPTVVVNGEKIHLLFLKNVNEVEKQNWEYNLISGKVDKKEANKINWGKVVTKPGEQFTVPDVNLEEYILIGSKGSGIFLQESFVVPMEYEKNSSYFSTIIAFSINEDNSWGSVSSTSFAEGLHAAVLEWENKLIMMTSSKAGYRKVYEYNDTGEEWKEAVTSLSGVWGNKKERDADNYSGQSGFIAANIVKDKKIILFTQTVGNEKNNKYKLHLWMTDFKRVYDAGAISADVDNHRTFSTLLYAQNNLFAAYQEKKDGKYIINFMHLKDQLNHIKNVFEKWTKQDHDLSNSCFAADGTLTEGDKCTNNNKIPTNGLVGFLSGNYSNGKWGDEYWCVNATVTEGTDAKNVTNGLRFNGTGAGAKWPVSEQGQNQRYHFANYGFTLVATVKIDGDVSDKRNSILGVGLGGSGSDKKSIGLWCSNGDWSVISKQNTAEGTVTAKPCVKEGIYQVALILDDNKFSVYIGEKKERTIPESTINVQQPLSITHFYFGAESNSDESSASESHVSVTNVLLYNRPFGENEINKLKEYIKPVEDIKTSDKNTNTTPQEVEEKEEKASSPSRKDDGGVCGGVRVFSLLLPLLCVSAPLLHL